MPNVTPKKLKDFFCSPAFFFSLVFLVLFWKFRELFQNGILPGWDTVPHQYFLKMMAQDYLPHFKMSGYDLNWFGGVPLFFFHPPLFFALVSLIHYTSFGLISLFLAFRIFLFLSFFLFSVSLYFFAKEFLGEKAAKWSALFGLFLVFYPKILSATGTGAAGSLYNGLVVNNFAISLFIWYFVFLERLRKNPKRSNFLLTVFALTALLLTHAMSALMAGLLLIIYLFFHRDRKTLKNVFLSGILAVLLSLFWLLPMLCNLAYSSAERFTVTRGIGISSSFLLSFPFSLQDIVSGNFRTFNFYAFFACAFFLPGLIRLFKEKKYFLAASFLTFAILTDNYLYASLPALTLHYDRLIPFILIIALPIASYGFACFLERFKTVIAKCFLIALFIAVTFCAVFNYDLKSDIVDLEPSLIDLPLQQYHYQMNQYPEAAQAEAAARYLTQLNVSGRFFSENSLTYLGEIGSPHYFPTVLAQNNLKMLDGFWPEGSLQVPFIAALGQSLAPQSNSKPIFWVWGVYNQQLLTNSDPFFHQHPNLMLDRLKLFNVSHVIAYTDVLKRSLDAYPDARLLQKFGNFWIYEMNNPKPLIYRATYKPGLFIDEGGEINFRQFASQWYKSPELLDFPFAESKAGLGGLTAEEADRFSVIVVSAKNLNNGKLKLLNNFSDHPILIMIDPQKNPLNFDRAKEKANIPRQAVAIEDFKMDSSLLVNAVTENKSKYLLPAGGEIRPEAFDNEEISFVSVGPTVVNASYFPYWRSAEKGQGVYQVTPGQMLVFADGETTLRYESDWAKKAGILTSWLTLMAMIGSSIRTGLRKNKING